MKAVICKNYGPPEVLQIQEVPKPIPKDHELLVKIIASAVNSGDVRVRSLDVKGFMKIIMRLVLGISKPRKPILGTVFSGIVVGIGKNVTRFKVGDKVFGMTGLKFGTYAEYVTVNQNGIVVNMPVNARFEEAAALPFGGQTAIYYLNKARINKRTKPKVLIIGATGAVGTAAIQIANYYHSDITAVCSTNGVALVKSLGVNHIVLYDMEDYTKLTHKYDIIFDATGKSKPKECQLLLNEKGVYKTVGSGYATETIEQLQLLKSLFEQGRFRAVIDKIYPMEEITAAHRYVDTGRKKGNVIISINNL